MPQDRHDTAGKNSFHLGNPKRLIVGRDDHQLGLRKQVSHLKVAWVDVERDVTWLMTGWGKGHDRFTTELALSCYSFKARPAFLGCGAPKKQQVYGPT